MLYFSAIFKEFIYAWIEIYCLPTKPTLALYKTFKPNLAATVNYAKCYSIAVGCCFGIYIA